MLMLLKAQKAISHCWNLLIAGLKECHWRQYYPMIQIHSGRYTAKVTREVLQMLRKEIYQHLMKFSSTFNLQLSTFNFLLLHQEPHYSSCFIVGTHYCSNLFNY